LKYGHTSIIDGLFSDLIQGVSPPLDLP
jgi:hypothetical protein